MTTTYTLISFRPNYVVYVGRGDYDHIGSIFIHEQGLTSDELVARVVELRTVFPDGMNGSDHLECREYWFEDVEELSAAAIAMEDKIESMVREHDAEKEKACLAAKQAKKEEAYWAKISAARSKNESDLAMLRELAAKFPDEVAAMASAGKPAHSPGDGQA